MSAGGLVVVGVAGLVALIVVAKLVRAWRKRRHRIAEIRADVERFLRENNR